VVLLLRCSEETGRRRRARGAAVGVAAEEEEFEVLESWREEIGDLSDCGGFWSCCDA
jgi:hypothetical protein